MKGDPNHVDLIRHHLTPSSAAINAVESDKGEEYMFLIGQFFNTTQDLTESVRLPSDLDYIEREDVPLIIVRYLTTQVMLSFNEHPTQSDDSSDGVFVLKPFSEYLATESSQQAEADKAQRSIILLQGDSDYMSDSDKSDNWSEQGSASYQAFESDFDEVDYAPTHSPRRNSTVRQ